MVTYDRPELSLHWLSAGSGRIYIGIGTTESDVWVATLCR